MTMVAANVFGYYMTWINLPRIVATAMLGLTSNKYIFLLACNVILLIMGMFLEGGAALMIVLLILTFCPVLITCVPDLLYGATG
ncbi:MAG: TRAP transporter large permease subunit [Clostridiales bacterium]|nr:TRAP transporter large permease subunit [Clostridiales bacterium]